MAYSTDRNLPQGKFSLTLQVDELVDKSGFAAQVTKVWDDGAAQDVTHLVRGSLHEHRGADRGEAVEKATVEVGTILGIDTGELLSS